MRDQPNRSSDLLASLISAAGRREAPPAQAYERALKAATQVWRAQVRRRRWRIASTLAAGLACVVVGVLVAIRSPDSPSLAPEALAEVARVIGDVRVQTGAADWSSLREGAGPLSAGDVVHVGTASAAALDIGGSSVRMDSGTELVLESSTRVRLRYGRVYVDTGGDSIGGMLVATDTIAVSDVGTQFEVQQRGDSTRVRVREGAVLLERGGMRQRGAAGEQISIDAAGLIVEVSEIPPNDREWRWIEALATAPDIDDRPLTVLLDWVSRETGAPVRYASPAVQRKATITILHGSIRNLEPLAALSVMLATTDLTHEVLADGTIMIK